MMQGPDKRSIVVRGPEGLVTKVEPLKKRTGVAKWPLIRGVVNFGFVYGVRREGAACIRRSSSRKRRKTRSRPNLSSGLRRSLAVRSWKRRSCPSPCFSAFCFPSACFSCCRRSSSGIFDRWIHNAVVRSLIEGVIRIAIFMGYMILISRMKDMKRVFSYHGAEHKTIRCYEAQLPLTVENCRGMTRLHPRCGTSFLFVVVAISILLFALVSAVFPTSNMLVRMLIRLALLPFVVSISYECNRFVGRHDNALTRALSAPGMWFQHFTTNEPDDSMLEVAIEALKLVIPDEVGPNRW